MVDQLARKLADPDEQIRYAALRALEPNELVRALPLLMERLRDESWRVRKAAVEKVAGVRPSSTVIPLLISALGDGDDAGVRNAAADALTRIGRAAVLPLAMQLADPDPDLRKFATDILGEVRDRRAVAGLVLRLEDADRNVRAAAAEALGKIGGEEAFDALVALLDSEDHLLKASVLDALARCEEAPPLEKLRPLTQDRFLRRAAYRLLARSPELEAVELLLEGVCDPGRGAREAALSAFALQRRTRGPAGREILAELVRRVAAQREALEPACISALGVGDLNATEGALAILAWLGKVELTLQIAALAEDAALEDRALDALVTLGPPAVPFLREALSSLGPAAAANAVRALGRLGDASAVEDLLRYVPAASEWELRAAAIEALGELRALEAGPALFEAIDEGPPVATAAAAALVRVASQHPEAVRKALLDRLARKARPELLLLLGRVGEPADLAILRQMLGGASASLRAAAAAALGELRLEEAVHLLCRALSDESAAVRAAAARGLASLAPLSRAEGSATLLAALRDRDPRVVAEAALALGAVGDDKAAAALRERLAELVALPKGEWTPAAIAAVRSLAALRAADAPGLRPAFSADAELIKEAANAAGEDSRELLVQLLRHPGWDVRKAVIQALGRIHAREAISELEALDAIERDPLVREAIADTLLMLGGRTES